MMAAAAFSKYITSFENRYFYDSDETDLDEEDSSEFSWVEEIPMCNFYQTLNNYLKLFGVIFSLADKSSQDSLPRMKNKKL